MSEHIWYTHAPSPSAFGVALRQGWIHEEMARAGIEVRALAASSDPDVQRFRRETTSPRAFRQGGNVAPLIARSRGNDIRLIGLSRISSAHNLLAAPDSKLRTAGDLIGSRIAVPVRPNASVDVPRATALRTIANLLASTGLGLGDVNLVEVPVQGSYFDSRPRLGDPIADGPHEGVAFQVSSGQSEEVQALLRGEVDAIASEAAAVALLASALGLRAITPGNAIRLDLNNRSLLAVTVSGGLLDRDPGLVIGVLVQLLTAAEWAIDEEAEARRLIALDAGIHEDMLDAAYSPRVSRQLGIDLRMDKVADLRLQHDFLLGQGIIQHPVDLDAFIDPEPLKTALARRGVLV
ncbi:MAG: ABC transporter substrate-binding protein [Solirubrobacterales bacterium]|nr:ABC transporter substrate-binding protein [Solirubrobacterales bacterium]